MSYIPPISFVCDTPPPIDFEDNHEDDFGDGMFSNYDGKCLEKFFRSFDQCLVLSLQLSPLIDAA